MPPIRLIALAGLAAILAGCAQTETAPDIRPQPTFDKYGNGSCEPGYIYIPGTAPIPECIPEDDCEPLYNADGSLIECPPPPPPTPRDNDNDRRPTTPGTAPTGAPLN